MGSLKEIEKSESNSTINSSALNKRRKKIEERLEEVIKAYPGYQFIQQNGQRIFEPCTENNLNPPSKGCEIFIGNIPKYLYEDVLIPLFQQVGQLYKFRLMLDFNQKNRGYAFATYFFAHHATEALAKYDGFKLSHGASIAVFKSVDNRRLFIGNIPRTKTREDVECLLNRYVDGLVDVIMYPSWYDNNLNRGFAFLEFESHSMASVARRHLHPRNLVEWDHPLYVDWADPVPDVDPLVMAQVSVLYVKNLPAEINNDALFTLFRNISGPALIKKTHKTLSYAFVHCKNRWSAEIVMNKLKGLTINGQTVDIEWARPRQYSSQWRSMQLPENYCLSVPLRTRKLIREITSARKASSYAASKMESPSSNSSSSIGSLENLANLTLNTSDLTDPEN